MGYFNIFYKLTRIIDFFTKKRNRKFLIIVGLLVGIVFFSPNTANAQFSSYDSNNIASIKSAVTDIDNALDVHLSVLYTSLLNQEYDIDIIRQNCTTIIGSLGSMQNNLQSIRTDVLTLKNTLTDIDSEIEDLLTYIVSVEDKINNINQILINIDNNVEYYGELNHADIEDLKEIIKEYMYGDRQDYPITNYFVYGLLGNPTGEVFTNSGNYNTFYFKVKAGYTYHVSWDLSILSQNNRRPRHGFCNVVPKDGVPLTDLTFITEDIREMDVYAEEDTIFWISYDKTRNIAFKVMSDYNEGQDLGIYGGLTIIDQQTQYQGEETRQTIQDESQATRDTITSTDYNQSDVNVNTSAIDSVSTTETQGLFTTIFNNFNSAITGGVDSIIVPLPHGGQLVLYSNVVSSHLGNLSALVSAFWYFVFGLYAFKFVNNIIRSIKSGDILNGFSNNNEVITSDML